MPNPPALQDGLPCGWAGGDEALLDLACGLSRFCGRHLMGRAQE
jgi:hypothetical protein